MIRKMLALALALAAIVGVPATASAAAVRGSLTLVSPASIPFGSNAELYIDVKGHASDVVNLRVQCVSTSTGSSYGEDYQGRGTVIWRMIGWDGTAAVCTADLTVRSKSGQYWNLGTVSWGVTPT